MYLIYRLNVKPLNLMETFNLLLLLLLSFDSTYLIFFSKWKREKEGRTGLQKLSEWDMILGWQFSRGNLLLDWNQFCVFFYNIRHTSRHYDGFAIILLGSKDFKIASTID